MVGQRLVDEILVKGRHRSKNIGLVVIGEEPQAAYDRVGLSGLFDGRTVEDLTLADVDAMRAVGVDLRLGTKATAIDRSQKTVALSSGDVVAYDHLVLATGSVPFVPPISGADRPGCFEYRTLSDIDAIRSWSERPEVQTGAVIGGGLLGLEAANALLNLGLDTHVIEMADRLMPQQLDGPAATALERWISGLGVTCHLGFATSEVVSDRSASSAGPVTGLCGREEEMIPADLVVFSAGIRPQDELAAEADLAVGERGGVVVDDYCLTSDPFISAVGEVACHAGRTYGLVGPGYSMAAVVAENLTGGEATFEGADTSTKLKLLGVDVASFGTSSASDDKIEYTNQTTGVHRRVSLVNDRVVGGVLVGDISHVELLQAMASGDVPTANVEQLIIPDSLGSADNTIELPDSMQLCSCNAVTRQQCKQAVADGARTAPEVKAATSAGTGCGGCIPDLTALVNIELEALGVSVDRTLCEHFRYTRQELFDLIRVHRHAGWAEVLSAHGTGGGCEICRPAVASILSSLSNGYILDGDQATLQDTNDHALANMQRNGTYSVVPRVPGGEITPEQLIALGEIGRDFDLYTKITGAQRIDLFGAQLHELPLIWQRVVDAGLESGHAYGKALRTVKSCVGSTWCRYGVQDSVSMAIRLELRYRGLRAPHKLKSAVSGCTRECAEAQSKDFGVIATETGWNLYVGGNGGRTPRHGDLFATDLTDDELVTYIDRFLMFYIRTAERLQRTASWLEELDGGVDYLRSVVIDDSLGICGELEADMALHVERYQCEWTATLEQPERLRHFVEFVNAPESTSTPVWISERGQRIPAR